MPLPVVGVHRNSTNPRRPQASVVNLRRVFRLFSSCSRNGSVPATATTNTQNQRRRTGVSDPHKDSGDGLARGVTANGRNRSRLLRGQRGSGLGQSVYGLAELGAG